MSAAPKTFDQENSEAMIPENCVKVSLVRGSNGYGFSIIGGVDQPYKQLKNTNSAKI